MATTIVNEAGEHVYDAGSDAEAARWWLEEGRVGDYLGDTGEKVSKVVTQIFPDAHWRIDRNGAVRGGDTGEGE